MKNFIRILFLLVLLFTNYLLFAGTNSDYNYTISDKNPINNSLSIQENVASETQILRLEFRVSNGASRSFVLGFTEDATDGFDYGYDGGLITNPPGDDMGSLLNGQQYVIQAFSPITPDKEIDLVLHATGDHTYTLISTEITNIPDDQDLMLRDNLTGEIIDLRDKDGYEFTSKAGTFMDRFKVTFQSPALSSEEFTENKMIVHVSQSEAKLYVRDLIENVSKLSFINMLGQTVVSYSEINNKTLEDGIDVSTLNAGVYLVHIKSDSNLSRSRKVIIN